MAFTLHSKDDPHMHQSLVIHGVAGLVEANCKREFQLDFSQYIELIRASYETLCAFDEFANYLSFGTFQYFCVVLLWKRLYFILSKRGLKVSETHALDKILNFELPVPKDIKIYLEGVGDLKDDFGNEYHLSLQGVLSSLSIERLQGSYGKIDESNLIMYETLPSLMICLLKINADKVASGSKSYWTLPSQLLQNSYKLTRNLLGWWPAEVLRLEQQETLRGVILIDRWGYCVENVGYLPIHNNLIRAVANILKSTNRFDNMPLNRYGSISQIAFTSITSCNTGIDRIKSISKKMGRTSSYIQMPSNIACGAAIFRYRLKRYEGEFGNMLGVMGKDTEVYQKMLERENDIFNFGIGGTLWNSSLFGLYEQSGHALISSFSKKMQDIANENNLNEN